MVYKQDQRGAPMAKKKVRKLTEEEYEIYVRSLLEKQKP